MALESAALDPRRKTELYGADIGSDIDPDGCIVSELGPCVHNCGGKGRHAFQDKMLADITASRHDVPTTRACWKVCQCFYDLTRKNDAQRQRQAQKCVLSGCNSRVKLQELGEASLLVQARFGGCQAGDWACERCRKNTGRARATLAVAGGASAGGGHGGGDGDLTPADAQQTPADVVAMVVSVDSDVATPAAAAGALHLIVAF